MALIAPQFGKLSSAAQPRLTEVNTIRCTGLLRRSNSELFTHRPFCVVSASGLLKSWLSFEIEKVAISNFGDLSVRFSRRLVL
jgi:hypothetical protein